MDLDGVGVAGYAVVVAARGADDDVAGGDVVLGFEELEDFLAGGAWIFNEI